MGVETTVQAASRSLALRLKGLARAIRAHPKLSALAVAEEWREQRGGFPADERHEQHLSAAIDWLVRAQDATPDDGFARGYSITWDPYFGRRGWQPSYPETTGYIIPTMYAAARVLDRPELAERAERAARWESTIQLESGAVRGGVMGQPVSPSVFNTGQVIFGWLTAWRETGDPLFSESARRASKYLADVIEADGHWRKGNSLFARADTTMYNTRVAWALADAGRTLGEPQFVDAAARNLRAVIARQHSNGWIPDCCLNDPEHPLLHTLAYCIRGLVEGGTVLEDESIVQHGVIAAEALMAKVRQDGWMAGRLDATWGEAVTWSCLTGEAQMANIWLRLHELLGEERWIEPVPRVLRFIKRTQNRTASEPGLRGGIKGSAPLGGGYGTYQILNWATKFFADALIRDMARAEKAAGKTSVSPNIS